MQKYEHFEQLFGAAPMLEVSAAGRINLIGEHVDYCGGKVMPASLNLKSTVLARRNGTHVVRVYADDLNVTAELDLNDLDQYRGLGWGKYHAGVLSVMKKAGMPLVGCDLYCSCTVPFGSGLSSSAAIEVSAAVVFQMLAGTPYDLVQTAVLCQKAENEYCGVNCGIMDQFASAMGKKDKAILLDCKTLDYEYIPLKLGRYELIVSNCNKPHALVTSKYNERRAEVDRALELLRPLLPHAACLADFTPEQFESAKHVLSGKLLDRATHVVEECERVRKAAEALKQGDILTLAGLINASHDSLSRLYEVTGKEPDALAYAARATDGCIASRMIGAGFGGCTISLVEQGKTETFKEAVGRRYYHETGYHASFYDTSIEDGVTIRTL